MADTQNNTWEQTALEKIMFENLKEQKRRRRWGILIKLLFLLFLFFFLILIWPTDNTTTSAMGKAHIGLVDVKGEIGDSSSASADNVMTGLQKAFKDKNTLAVILRINSPGGSPVQSSNIYNEMIYQRKKYPKIKLY